MKKGTLWGLFLLIGVLIGVALIDATATRPIDWSESYLIKDKDPFGLYVFAEEVGNILPGDRNVYTYGESIYEKIDQLDSVQDTKQALIEINRYNSIMGVELDNLLDYISKGGEVFLAAEFFQENLLDTLGIDAENLDYGTFYPDAKRISYSLANDTAKVFLPKTGQFPVFSKLNPSNTTILGYLHARGKAIPNFIQIKYGKGFLYLHLVPSVFTNYYLLREDTYRYVAKTVNILQKKEIGIYDFAYEWDQPMTPLRVILSKPGFAQAWYLLLFGLVVLLVFKSRREQRPIPVITPEPNRSKEFAQAIGNLYYESGSPGNIIQKKIEYFLFDIRTVYQLDTLHLDDDKFIKQLVAKSAVSKDVVDELLLMIKHYRSRESDSMRDVVLVNNKIEEFKQKANWI